MAWVVRSSLRGCIEQGAQQPGRPLLNEVLHPYLGREVQVGPLTILLTGSQRGPQLRHQAGVDLVQGAAQPGGTLGQTAHAIHESGRQRPQAGPGVQQVYFLAHRLCEEGGQKTGHWGRCHVLAQAAPLPGIEGAGYFPAPRIRVCQARRRSQRRGPLDRPGGVLRDQAGRRCAHGATATASMCLPAGHSRDLVFAIRGI